MDKIIYASVHHKNTKRVIDYLTSHLKKNFDEVNITKDEALDISDA